MGARKIQKTIMLNDLRVNLLNAKSKKVNCDKCKKRLAFSELKKAGSRFQPYLVCKKCYYDLH